MLASYASRPENTRGRRFFELPDLYRSCFEKDRERIIHSNAFKRLEYKTQVFVNHQGDHYRNRLIHSIEAANVARIIARKLSLCEDLAECIALSHDLGHPPFGHSGEAALNECMREQGGFFHNDFTIKLITQVERMYTAFDGLNLSWEIIEGVAKHNGPISSYDESGASVFNYNKEVDLQLNTYPSAEAQVASISDDIAYNSHDLEDGIRAGMFSIEDVCSIEFFKKNIAEIKIQFPNINSHMLIYESVRLFTKTLVYDVIEQSSNNIHNNQLNTPDDIRKFNGPVVAFSPAVGKILQEVRSFLEQRFYGHRRIVIESFKASKIIKDLFNLYMENSACMPVEWQKYIKGQNKARVVADYIAGMTDRYAIREHQSFSSSSI